MGGSGVDQTNIMPVLAETRFQPAREQRARCKKGVPPQKKLIIGGCPLQLTQQMAWETTQRSVSWRGGVRRPRRNSEWEVQM